jgi:hypothetical protein
MNVLRRSIIRLIERFHLIRFTFSDGSYIEFSDRETILYTDTDRQHQMEIKWFAQRGRLRGRVLRSASLERWRSPHDRETISAGKQVEIQNKIIEYCKDRRTPLRIE